MKHLKSLGLAAIAALGLMAFVGAGTASATTFATDAAGTIKYASGTTIHKTLEPGTSITWTDTSGNTIATCTGSTSHSTLETATGTWVGGKNSSLTWEGCSQTTDTIKPGSFEIMQTSGSEGEVRSKGMEVTLNIFGVSCVYGTGEGTIIETATSGSIPTTRATTTVPRVSGGFLCPSTAVTHAAYYVTSPHALYIIS